MAKTTMKLALLASAHRWAVFDRLRGRRTAELMSGASARMLSDTCAGCHGTDGASVGPASPTIAGMNGEYFVELMQGFKNDEVYGTIMGRIAKGYTRRRDRPHGRPSSPARSSCAAKQEFDDGHGQGRREAARQVLREVPRRRRQGRWKTRSTTSSPASGRPT